MLARQLARALCLSLALATAAWASDGASESKPLIVTLIKVDDGDSFAAYDVSGQRYRIRLAGIDAPERAQPHGQISGRNLDRLLANKSIVVFKRKKDQYKRWIAKVVVDGVDVGLRQVKAGNAWHYKRFAHEQPTRERNTFSDAEDTARKARIGLWQETNPLAPWQWRRNNRKKR